MLTLGGTTANKPQLWTDKYVIAGKQPAKQATIKEV
jgi:hypothetical protein